jgi:YafQ family addiction module toxin component
LYDLEIKPEADRIFSKLAKKNPKQMKIIAKKINEKRNNPAGYKFLKAPLDGFNRVHIDKHFVLIFQVNQRRKIVDIFYYAHHDFVYQWNPK